MDVKLKKLIQASWNAYAARNFSAENFQNGLIPSSPPIWYEAGYREAFRDLQKIIKSNRVDIEAVKTGDKMTLFDSELLICPHCFKVLNKTVNEYLENGLNDQKSKVLVTCELCGEIINLIKVDNNHTQVLKG